MIALLEIARSGFWSFLGTIIILSLVVRYAVMFVVGTVAAWRGGAVHFGAKTDGVDLSEFKKAMADGKLDAEIARANQRNAARAGR